MDEGIIRADALLKFLGGLHRNTLLKWESQGKFPRRIKIGSRAVGWNKKDVYEWMKSNNFNNNLENTALTQ